jgi:hypothetical protein
MAKIIIHSPYVLIYWPLRINLDRIGEIFSLPRILNAGTAASFPESKHREREAQ